MRRKGNTTKLRLDQAGLKLRIDLLASWIRITGTDYHSWFLVLDS